MIWEIMWIHGNPIYQTIFNLVYFSTDDVISNKDGLQYSSEGFQNIFRVYLDSTLHILYLTYSSVVECSSLREEDLMMIPVQNVSVLKRENVLNELRTVEKDLKKYLKDNPQSEQVGILKKLLSRIKLRIYFLSIIKEQFDFSYKKRYNNLLTLTNTLKNSLNEVKNLSNEEGLFMTEGYFSEELCRIAPTISSIKLVKKISYKDSLDKFLKLIDHLNCICTIYDENLTNWSQLPKALETLNNDSPSFLIRSIIELNLFPKGENKLFGNLDFKNLLFNTLTKDFKVKGLEENSEYMSNFLNVQKEILIKNLRNKARQVRDSSSLFEGLIYLVFESNQIEKALKKSISKNTKNPFVPVLTNYNLRKLLMEMLSHIFTSFELELFTSFELDYVFYLAGNVLDQLCTSCNIVAASFGDKILKENEMAKSLSKSKLNLVQKSIMDEIYIFNALRCAIRGIAIVCRYMKVSGIINSPESESTERLRITNRFPSFKNCRYIMDISYENFVKDTYFDLNSEKEMILQSADSFMKQSIKYLNELKSADLNIRDDFHYSNTFIDNLSKSIISNNLFLSKIKKLDKKGVKINYVKKYPVFLPVLEMSN